MTARKAVLLTLIFLLTAVFACGMDSGREVDEISSDLIALKKGKKAEDFKLKDMNGKDVSLADYKGKIVFLNFWATWCPPCREEMPSMEKLHKKYSGRGLVVLALATDRKGDKIVRPYIEEKGFSFPVLLDSDADVADSYSIFALPTTYIIGRDGTILDTKMGAADWFSKEKQAYFEELIGKGTES